MAPIAPDSQPVSTCTPLHFGPPIPEIESNWFRFYVYKISGCGPASILFPKGYIVRRLPTIFEGVQKLCIIPWDHEPIITNYGQALPVLNNRLKSKPVLVHAYSKCNSNPTFVDVPFPLPRESVDLLGNTTPTGPEETGFNSKNMHMHPAVIKLSHSLSLDHSCGYIRMINIPSDHSSAPTVPVQQPEALVDTAASTSQPHVPEKTVPTSTSATPTDANSWMPFSLHFGIPLFNLPLNRAVCERIQQQQLFSVENLASFSGWSRMLCLRLLDFIAQCQSPSIAPRGTGGNLSATSSLTTPLPLSSDSVVPFPTCPVLFHEGMLYKAQDVQYGN
ncbi:protein FAM91A1 [Pelomyxa schiedti]|nr:protein FAM91A1 [Pelomyxa schiedti]